MNCPNCDEILIKKFDGDAVMAYCKDCGFEKAIVPEPKTKQSKLYF